LTPSNQIHDLNPGFPHGVLWTIPIPEGGLSVDLDAGTARLTMSNVALGDYGNFANSLFGGGGPNMPGPSVPAVASFDVRWSGVTARTNVKNASNANGGFTGEFASTGAHIDWSASESGFNFSSNSPGQNARAALIGHERNGFFFKGS
jgi:hypothetical protein